MPLPLTLAHLVAPLRNWLGRHCSSQQWLVGRDQITVASYRGWRPRIVLSRSLCLYYLFDLSKIPSAKRDKALLQQIRLHSPFSRTGHYVGWQQGKAMVWIWDSEALCQRLPQAERVACVPDSLLHADMADGERWLSGWQGGEWQRWQQGVLQDSRWQADGKGDGESDGKSDAFDPQQATPWQAQDRHHLIHVAWGAGAGCLLFTLLLQLGSGIDLRQRSDALAQQVASQEESVLVEQHARQRAQQARAQYLARQQRLSSDQSTFIYGLLAQLPAGITLLQRYDYQPNRLQLMARDSKPVPRDYVQRLEGLTVAGSRLSRIQVQLDPSGQTLTLSAQRDPAPWPTDDPQ